MLYECSMAFTRVASAIVSKVTLRVNQLSIKASVQFVFYSISQQDNLSEQVMLPC